MTYYSDNGVDTLIEDLLPSIGFACDVGANNGAFNSNTLHLEEKGWTVLCVEPNPLLAEEGASRRKLWRQVACGAEDKTGVFWAVGGYPYASNSSVGYGSGQAFEVPELRLDRVLEEAGFHRLDLLTVDVEGYEAAVMAGFTIKQWNPKIIVLESWEDNQTVPEGYERIERKQFDNVYLRKEG